MSDNTEEHANTSAGSLSSEPASLNMVVGRVAHAIDRILSPGDVAELRRLAPSDPSSPAFFKLMASTVDPGQELPSEGRARDAIERRWASLFQTAATMAGLHQPTRGLGYALASADYSELRLVRLLRARGDLLFKEARTCAHFLAVKAQECNLTDLARLVLVTDTERAEGIRRTIARAYYRHRTQANKES